VIRFKNRKRSILNKSLIFLSNFIRKLFGGDRLLRISGEIVNISKEISQKKKKKITVLDFGCGSMNVSKKLNKYSFIKQIVGIDTFYYKFQSKKMQYVQSNKFFNSNNTKFDLVIAIDVLHHIGIDQAPKILQKLSKISNNIIIKDHFEHGFFSRHLLRFVDFYANYAYGVNIPKKYFDYKSWNKTVKKSVLKEVKLIKNFQQHDGLFNLILNKKHHFISILKNVKF
jgi:SAM-dependent methyltransferase